MKPTLGSVAITASINNLWTRIEIPALAFLEKLWLTNGRADTQMVIKMRVNGVSVIHPITRAEGFVLPVDSALDIPDTYFFKRSAQPMVLEFQADSTGTAVSFAYFEMLNPVPMSS